MKVSSDKDYYNGEIWQIPLLQMRYRMDPNFQVIQVCLIHELSAVFSQKADEENDDSKYNKRD